MTNSGTPPTVYFLSWVRGKLAGAIAAPPGGAGPLDQAGPPPLRSRCLWT